MAEADLKQAILVILASVNGRDGWHPIRQPECPAWLLEPNVMGALVAGEMCMKCDEGESGSVWYRAETLHGDEMVH